ncbi:coth protein-domain-containing protein [Mucor mucedo]|uniref:coth protein-domain-containing protein n=1 Tax=Mucor mucedo TaxID=29922 RepID=UPI00221F937E|nr:coth protein-domain-containing protein [Mucor mucedo]KAI7868043.1 coth protein-domain-containing protein [Mucor mucedo]
MKTDTITKLGFYIALLATVMADSLYSVIVNSPNTDTGVIIGNKVYPLSPSSKSPILWQGIAPSNVDYSYVKIEKGTSKIIEREPFSRRAIQNDTVNEFFNRNWNTKSMVTFDTIESIPKNFNRHFDNHQIDNIHKNYLDDITISSNMTYISTSTVQLFTNVGFEVGGRSSRLFTKLAYNIKLAKKGGNLGGYRKLKLRTTVSDPSYMREYLATEMIYAANQPCSRASHVRVFINDRAIGLFSLLEKYDDTWLANTFGSGDIKSYSNGLLYEGEGGKKDENRADLSYKGDNPALYDSSAYSVAENPAQGVKNDFSDLIVFTKFIRDQIEFQKGNNRSAIEATKPLWEQQIDVEGFLVGMALEFIQGSWDAYQQNTNNYFLYKSPEQNRFIFISWDFDYVMGSGPVNMKAIAVGDYNSYGGAQLRPLMVALLNIPSYRELYEKNLNHIITSLYNPSKSFPVIDSVYSLLEDDVAWDKSLDHVRKGPEYLTLENLFKDSLGDDAGRPLCISYLNAIEFLIRINSKISFFKAVEGKTGHSSLYSIKGWINEKLENVKNKTTYKQLLPLK